MSPPAAQPRVGSGPDIGVVVPTLDEEELLEGLLGRLLFEGAPEDRADRVVVSDGGSRDRTHAIVRASARGAPGRLEWIEGSRGRGAQLAAGAERMSSAVLCFLHADCLPAPGALAAMRAAFADPALGAAAFRQRVDAEGWFYRAVERSANWRVRGLGLVYGDSGLCLRREVYSASGGFRALPVLEDVDLSRRLRPHARPRVIAAAGLHVSARRWKREGALRATVRNWMLLGAYAAGARPERLARFYTPHRLPEGHPRGS